MSTTVESQPHAAPLARPRTVAVFGSLIVGLLVALVVAIIAAVAVGAVAIPFGTVVRIIVGNLFPDIIEVDWTPTEDQIVWVFRLPRVLLAVIVGAALSVSGTALQAMVRNPLADPYIFGVSSGASVGAVAVLTLGAATGSLSLSVAAFGGALVAMIIVYLMAQQNGRTAPTRLILAGVALAYVLQAITSYLVLRVSGPNGGAAAVLTWLAGSLGRAKWEYLGLPSLVVAVATVLLLLQARSLNALLAGEETATSLGVNIERFRLQLFVLTSLLVGVVVAISGAIGFVGLMIPHITRMLVGADHRRVLPIAALLGGVYLVFVDLLGRTIIAPQELPVGIVTAALGGPFFLWLLRQRGC
ncbi:MAG: iron ABC transporter permease [Chloroflexales bacterium]|nr:iron ABC transporter permease [Chloroflexales bacterium]